MRKTLHFLLFLFFSFSSLLFFPSCNNGLKTDNNEKNQANEKDNNDNQPVGPTTVNADSFFWGTWVRMDNGNEYEFLENSVLWSGKKYCVSASDDNSVTVKDLGRFNKESDSVIVCDNIPYFRKGGTNLEYSLKLVGFISSEQQSARAAGSVMPGVKGKGKSKKYKTFEDDSESDVEGIIKFKAPTVDDIQTVTITTGNDIVVIPELCISNSGDYMGTVALVGKNDYNLKITGTISDSQKDGGYLYGNNAKSYEMVLTITNISENKCKSSVCTISTDDPYLNLSSETNLQGFTISTLEGGATKTLIISVSYGILTEPYINTGINIKLTNPSTEQEWVDYIPLRFFKGTIPITISAKNPENNKNAALNGFVIYPDGNNQFFAIPHNSSKSVFVPTFGKDKSYKLVFSGATVTSKLDDSTEMYYTVEPASMNPRDVVTEGDAQELIEYMNFGGDNHSETTAYSVTQGFESYLSEGEIDYYTIKADSDCYYSADEIPLFSISYENEKGSSPETILVKEGYLLTPRQLPELECEGYEFLGWYDGDNKIAEGYKVNDDLVLNAKWKKVLFLVTFQTEYGDVPKSITVYDGTVLKSDNLPLLDDKLYLFGGWYDGDEQVQAGKYVVNKDVSLVAKWNKKCLISYVSEYGTVPETIVFGCGNKLTKDQLPILSCIGYSFKGWYNENSIVTVEYVVMENIVLTAKWEEFYDEFVFVEGGTFQMGSIDGSNDEKPVHSVTISDFFISPYETTQKLYNEVMGINPSYFNSSPTNGEVQNLRPVEKISWYDIIYFCNKYSELVGLKPCYSVNGNSSLSSWNYIPHRGNSISGTITCDFSVSGYRLPTEAEWEFAARGGSKSNDYIYSGSNAPEIVAYSYVEGETGMTHEVGKKKANELGIYDMTGNVWEWCWDWYDSYSSESACNPQGPSVGSERVLRGGPYSDWAMSVSDRGHSTPDNRYYSYTRGFRLARSGNEY